jgi:hypothetical protein
MNSQFSGMTHEEMLVENQSCTENKNTLPSSPIANDTLETRVLDLFMK